MCLVVGTDRLRTGFLTGADDLPGVVDERGFGGFVGLAVEFDLVWGGREAFGDAIST